MGEKLEIGKQSVFYLSKRNPSRPHFLSKLSVTSSTIWLRRHRHSLSASSSTHRLRLSISAISIIESSQPHNDRIVDFFALCHDSQHHGRRLLSLSFTVDSPPFSRPLTSKGIKPGTRGPSMVTGGLIGLMGGFMYAYQNSAGRLMGFFPNEDHEEEGLQQREEDVTPISHAANEGPQANTVYIQRKGITGSASSSIQPVQSGSASSRSSQKE